MGSLLIAPKFFGGSWSYDLVSEVIENDLVLHWESSGHQRGLVGWSVAKSAAEVVPSYTWQPRGTSGRALPVPRTTEGWLVGLSGFNALRAPLTSQRLQKFSNKVLAVGGRLRAAYGDPTYFPFYLYGGKQLRAQQGYLLKFPRELFDVLPDLQEVRAAEAQARDQRARELDVHDSSKMRRTQDPLLRSALELHAVARAEDHYRRLGATDIVRLGKPYDLSLVLRGSRRHVEVKGSSVAVDRVELTANEVTHAHDHQPTDLVVVDRIR